MVEKVKMLKVMVEKVKMSKVMVEKVKMSKVMVEKVKMSKVMVMVASRNQKYVSSLKKYLRKKGRKESIPI